MKYLILTKRKPGFQETVLTAHFEYLQELRAAAKLGLAGGFTDKTGGAYVIEAENLEAARKIAFADPVYLTGSSDVTVYEWNARD